jgi:quinol-cytochrome oxidoreductase complex cytochrome b subunit
MNDIDFGKLTYDVKQNNNSHSDAKRLSIVKQPIFSVLNDHIIQYPAPTNLTYWWGYGSTAGICLLIQLVSGIFLAMVRP